MTSPSFADETAAPVAPVAPGDVLDGRFRVERVLAAGGIGVVVAAEHLALGQRVALKFLLPEAARSPETVQRFHREAATAAKLRSAHVARTFDTGVLPDGSPYIVMEYLEGRDLSAYVAATGALPPAEAVTYVLQALEAVAEAHVARIVHRDLKPHNLFLTEVAGRPTIKVLDFGIAKIGEAVTQLTQTGTFLGTPQYMAPEQLRDSGALDARADLYAFGVILFELLSARRPFEGESLPELVTKILFEAPPPLEGPGIPQELVAVVERCLAKAPGERYADAGALATALEPFGGPDAVVLAERVRRASEPSGVAGEPSGDCASIPTVLGSTGDGVLGVAARSMQGTAIDVAEPSGARTRPEVPHPRSAQVTGRSRVVGVVAFVASIALAAGAGAGVLLVRHGRTVAESAQADTAPEGAPHGRGPSSSTPARAALAKGRAAAPGAATERAAAAVEAEANADDEAADGGGPVGDDAAALAARTALDGGSDEPTAEDGDGDDDGEGDGEGDDDGDGDAGSDEEAVASGSAADGGASTTAARPRRKAGPKKHHGPRRSTHGKPKPKHHAGAPRKGWHAPRH